MPLRTLFKMCLCLFSLLLMAAPPGFAQCADTCAWSPISECFMCHTDSRPYQGFCIECKDRSGGQVGNFAGVRLSKPMLPARPARPAAFVGEVLAVLMSTERAPYTKTVLSSPEHRRAVQKFIAAGQSKPCITAPARVIVAVALR